MEKERERWQHIDKCHLDAFFGAKNFRTVSSRVFFSLKSFFSVYSKVFKLLLFIHKSSV